MTIGQWLIATTFIYWLTYTITYWPTKRRRK